MIRQKNDKKPRFRASFTIFGISNYIIPFVLVSRWKSIIKIAQLSIPINETVDKYMKMYARTHPLINLKEDQPRNDGWHHAAYIYLIIVPSSDSPLTFNSNEYSLSRNRNCGWWRDPFHHRSAYLSISPGLRYNWLGPGEFGRRERDEWQFPN